MDYNYNATGGISVFGGAVVKVEYFYFTKFSKGVVAYNRQAAQRRGKLEAVVIKKYKLLFNPKDVLYTDTLNGLWNEADLCSRLEAATLAIAHHERIAREAEILLGLKQ